MSKLLAWLGRCRATFGPPDSPALGSYQDLCTYEHVDAATLGETALCMSPSMNFANCPLVGFTTFLPSRS